MGIAGITTRTRRKKQATEPITIPATAEEETLWEMIKAFDRGEHTKYELVDYNRYCALGLGRRFSARH